MVRPIWSCSLAVLLALPVACDKDEPAESTPSAEAMTPSSPGGASAPRRSGLRSIKLSKAVPRGAAGVLVVRTPESLFATIAGYDLFGEPEQSDVDQLREELDRYLEERIGVTLTEVDGMTVFMVPKAGVAAIVDGAKGTAKGKKVGEHEGVELLALGKGTGDAAVVAQAGKQLIIGQPDAVKLALSAVEDDSQRLRDEGGPMVDLLTDDSKGVSLAAVVEVGRLPEDLREEADKFGVEQAMLHYGDDGVRLVVRGSDSSMTALSGLITTGLDGLVAQAAEGKSEALDGDNTLEGAAAIYAHHSMKRLRTMMVPKVEDGTLSLEVPVQIQDPAILTAVAGIAAAIAVPALTKYMRRAKTSEARVQIAKMFDATSSYFNEEHVSRGAVTILGTGGALPSSSPHQCPNDGRVKGEAGLTPPLSVNCNEGPGGRCVPVEGKPTRPGEYSMELWTKNPVWNAMNFQMEQAHYFHYNFQWNNESFDGGEFGACQFTAQAFGDLDDDRVMSTYERSGAGDKHGINAAAGLYIDQEVE